MEAIIIKCYMDNKLSITCIIFGQEHLAIRIAGIWYPESTGIRIHDLVPGVKLQNGTDTRASKNADK
jgi:hypothetical protein